MHAFDDGLQGMACLNQHPIHDRARLQRRTHRWARRNAGAEVSRIARETTHTREMS